VIACHCSQCRRSTGAAFNPNASVPVDSFRIVTGKELVPEFSRQPGAYRAFRSRCGSPLYGRGDAYPTIVRVRLGILGDTQGAHPIAYIFTGFKADWFNISDGAEQFEDRPTPDPMRYVRTAE